MFWIPLLLAIVLSGHISVTESFTITNRQLPISKALQQQLYSNSNVFTLRASTSSQHEDEETNKMSSLSSATGDNETVGQVDIVLFGIGDLRTDDHGGLSKALATSNSNNVVIPLFIMDNKDTLINIPGIKGHTIDTSSMIHSSLLSLKENLMAKYNLPLQILKQESIGLHGSLLHFIELIKNNASLLSDTSATINVHVCDLGTVDNQMKYGPYSHLQSSPKDNFHLQPWSCPLRNEPWDNIQLLPESYPDYVKSYQKKSEPLKPIETPSVHGNDKSVNYSSFALDDETLTTTIPSVNDIVCLIKQQSPLNGKEETAERYPLEEEVNTGLYGTHWGGLDYKSIGEECVLNCLNKYTNECNEQDSTWTNHPDYLGIGSSKNNNRSLEHAAMTWMMKGKDSNNNKIETGNMIAGESMTRFLAAPLLFGTISSRRIWHSSSADKSIFFTSTLRTVVESREWHKLLACKNIKTNPTSYSCDISDSSKNGDGLQYRYWRWHGFLCRYAIRDTTLLSKVDEYKEEEGVHHSPDNSDSGDDEGIILVHGFGASSSQFQGTINELSKSIKEEIGDNNDNIKLILAPDLIGFGQCEKPPITYTQYLWESYISSFIKEVVLNKEESIPKIDKFVIGGNSIGGYTAMGSAANDNVVVSTSSRSSPSYISASGAPGTGSCSGVVLLNSAGQINGKEEIADNRDAAVTNNNDDDSMMEFQTIAETTISNSLQPCSPPPRPLARLFGNGLLSYLRPQISSICVNLYPTNPTAVNDILSNNILRDSLDPGAINVMISGSKLPPPRTANELLGASFGSAVARSSNSSNKNSKTTSGNRAVAEVREGIWGGPVLVAQGLLDPLNDAKSRASLLSTLREGIDVTPINAGHCPHDELPKDVSDAIITWLKSRGRKYKMMKDNGEEEEEETSSFLNDQTLPIQN